VGGEFGIKYELCNVYMDILFLAYLNAAYHWTLDTNSKHSGMLIAWGNVVSHTTSA
jgi:hypothetical protein